MRGAWCVVCVFCVCVSVFVCSCVCVFMCLCAWCGLRVNRCFRTEVKRVGSSFCLLLPVCMCHLMCGQLLEGANRTFNNHSEA